MTRTHAPSAPGPRVPSRKTTVHAPGWRDRLDNAGQQDVARAVVAAAAAQSTPNLSQSDRVDTLVQGLVAAGIPVQAQMRACQPAQDEPAIDVFAVCLGSQPVNPGGWEAAAREAMADLPADRPVQWEGPARSATATLAWLNRDYPLRDIHLAQSQQLKAWCTAAVRDVEWTQQLPAATRGPSGTPRL